MIKPLPQKVFLKTFENVPRLAISLVVENKKHELLLTQRAIPPKKGSWHLPGAFVLKGESLAQCVKRISKKELGLVLDPERAKLVGAFDDLHKDPRGHVVDLIYKLTISVTPIPTEETKEIKFFAKLPPSISFNHGDTLRTLGYK
jgi:ADP-ribose pyrophosphatase YjhB (NUDIX family)